MLSTDCLCVEDAAGYPHNPSCPAVTRIPYCEDCQRQRRCVCQPWEPERRKMWEPGSDDDPWVIADRMEEAKKREGEQ